MDFRSATGNMQKNYDELKRYLNVSDFMSCHQIAHIS
jgi:hypothetical protein